MDRISQLFGSVPTHNKYFIISSSIATTLTVLTIARLAFYPVPPKIIPSPRKTLLPKLSKKEQDNLPYPPDVFLESGARDVDSPVSHVNNPPTDDGRLMMSSMER